MQRTTTFLLSSAEITKNEPFLTILVTITPGVNMITGQITQKKQTVDKKEKC